MCIRDRDYGWRIDGRLVSFVDEDFFALPTSIGQHIDRATCAASSELRAAVLGEFDSVLEFLDRCYHDTCASFREGVDHDLTAGAERVLRWLLDAEVQVVFASNAPAEKIIDWFGAHDFEVVDGRSTEPGSAPLRVYGRAGKQDVGGPATRRFGGREIHVDRPTYRAILEREAADLVVGDVLSLDLATPLHLRAEGAAGAPRAVGVMHLRHTPSWVLDAVGPAPDQVDHLVPHITALPRLVSALGARPRAPQAPAPRG